jgi:hypothetical protein
MLHINVLQTHGDPIHLEMNPDSNTMDLNRKLSERTGIDQAKIMLFNELGLFNKIHYSPINHIINNNSTLQLLIAEHPHPLYITEPIIHHNIHPFTLHYDYENDINHPNREEVQNYFTNKQQIYHKYLKQRDIWLKYIKQINQSIDYWKSCNEST